LEWEDPVARLIPNRNCSPIPRWKLEEVGDEFSAKANTGDAQATDVADERHMEGCGDAGE
jgi:hypothetical protein